MDVTEVRQAARASRCHVADLLADPELDQLIMTVVEAAEACGYVVVQQEWSVSLPSTIAIADLPVEPDADVS